MINNINSERNLSKIAIVVVGYNRIKSIKRLLGSLSAASYPSTDIPLVISIDACGDTELYEYVQTFDWKHGTKYVNIQKERLGLKNHIYKCGDLTKYFKAIVLLEDDLFVSPYFYSYIEKAVDRYGNDPRIAEISLYNNEQNGYSGLPFRALRKGADVYLAQDVSTWGECWTYSMWDSFVKWRDSHSEEYVLSVDMPDAIKRWTKAWSKYYNAYVVDTQKFVLYPYDPVSTNFSDAGEHGGDNNSLVQVHMLWGNHNFQFDDFESLVKYDIHFNNIELLNCLNVDPKDVLLDIYATPRRRLYKKYVLSSKKLPYKIIASYGACLRPIELNILYNIPGNAVFLYDTKTSRHVSRSGRFSYRILNYFAQNYNCKLLVEESLLYYWKQLKERFKH